MKKLLMIIIASLSVYVLNAQEKQVPTGKYSLDFNFSPAAFFDANAGPLFTMPGIKGRYFYRANAAYRLSTGLTTYYRKDYSGDDEDDYNRRTSMFFSLAPGWEKHFPNNRFSGYLGFEVPVTLRKSARSESINNSITRYRNEEGTDYTGIGINLVMGFDYYLFGRVYFGAEFNPGLTFRKYSDRKVGDDIRELGDNEVIFSLASSSGIRIGVKF